MGDFKKYLRNSVGWTTSNKIVVFESDDWGNIRMSGKDAQRTLLNAGIAINDNPFLMYDALESNSDLEMLFDVLCRFKDKTQRNPVFTALAIIANPDFTKIRENGFSTYEYEPFTATCERYPEHDKVAELWHIGINNRLFVPEFHGREHLNVQRWMRALKSGNKSLLLAFNNSVLGISKHLDGSLIPEHLAAFDIDLLSDIAYLENVIMSGTEQFERICGYKPRYFVPPNSPGPSVLEKTLKDCGIVYLNSSRVYKVPLGNNRYHLKFDWPGRINSFGQIYLSRNCFFEPVMNKNGANDWVRKCLREIQIAFQWHKPAVISTHRVNYTGFINPENRTAGLNALNELLKRITNIWPEVEFLTSTELGHIIRKSKKSEEYV